MASLGMMLFIAIMIVLPIILMLNASSAYPALGSQFSQFILWAIRSPVSTITIVVLLIFPVSVLLFVIAGSLQAMANEVVRGGETHAETSHSNLLHKFFPLAGTGAILTILIVIPNLVPWGLVWYQLETRVYGDAAFFLVVFSFLWTFFTFGLTSLAFPAVICGKGVQDAIKDSFRISIQKFDQVFGILLIMIIPFFIIEGPLLYFAMQNSWDIDLVMMEITSFNSIYLSGWWLFSIFFWFFFLLPFMQIAFARIYLVAIGEIIDSTEVQEIVM